MRLRGQLGMRDGLVACGRPYRATFPPLKKKKKKKIFWSKLFFSIAEKKKEEVE
jgi:hypothetical protein